MAWKCAQSAVDAINEDKETTLKAIRILTLCALVGAHLAAYAQSQTVKVGFLSTLSGPTAAIGTDVRDGLQLF